MDEKRGGATVVVALVEGEYEMWLTMIEKHFEVNPDGRNPAGKARVYVSRGNSDAKQCDEASQLCHVW